MMVKDGKMTVSDGNTKVNDGYWLFKFGQLMVPMMFNWCLFRADDGY